MKILKTLLVAIVAVLAFSPSTYAAQTFKDVSTKHSNYKEIEWAVSKGLLKGYSDNTFRPSKFLTESQFAKILTRYASPETLEGVDAADETSTVYSYLKSEGIMLDGHTTASFQNKEFTRLKVAKAFYQLYEGKAPASNVAVIDWMYAKGLTKGKGVSSNKYTDFGSHDSLKRAHISAFFSRYDEMANAEPLDDKQIVDIMLKNELGSTLELIDFDRVNFTTAVADEYFIYLRDKSASLVDEAKNVYIVASFNAETEAVKVLKKWSETSEYSFLQRASLNGYEQMIVWANTGSDLRLQLSVVAANNSGSMIVTPITKTYANGSFSVEGGTLFVEGDKYRLVNGVLTKY